MGRKPEGKAEKSFKHFGKRIDSIIEDLKKLKEQAKEKYPNEYEEIKRNKAKLKDEWDEFSSDERWSEAVKKVESAGKELAEAIKVVFKGKKD